MMRKIYILIAITLMSVSCAKWLDIKPYDKISQDELVSDESGFIKHLNGIYIELNSDMLYGGSLGAEMIEIMGGHGWSLCDRHRQFGLGKLQGSG